MATFPANGRLVNPRFEAYRIQSNDNHLIAGPPVSTTAHRLPLPVSLANLNSPTSAPSPGYKELKDRLLQQRLLPGSLPGHFAYVDDGRFVVLIVISSESDRPSFHPLISLSTHQGDSLLGPSSLHPLPDGKWLAADGFEEIVVLATSERGRRWTAVPVQSYKVASPQFRLLTAVQKPEGDIHVLMQSIRKEAANTSSGPSQRQQASSKTIFDVSLIVLSGTQREDGEEHALSTHVKWTVSGEDAVYYGSLHRNGLATLIAEEAFASQHHSPPRSDASAITSSNSEGPSAPIVNESDSQIHTQAVPANFSWLQTSDSLTVIFQLPHQLAKKDIRIHFDRQELSLGLGVSAETAIERGKDRIVEIEDEGNADEELDPGQQAMMRTAEHIWKGRYGWRNLWGSIDPSNSVWTWERVGNGKNQKGLLTLHLEKKVEGTRWLTVFEHPRKRRASTEASTSQSQRPRIEDVIYAPWRDDVDDHEFTDEFHYDDDLDEPPEILDPSDLLTMAESLDKYTAREGSGFNDAPEPRDGGLDLDLGARDSLLRDQLEPEDAVVGKKLQLGTITPECRGQDRATINAHSDGSQLWTLATPIPEYRSNDDEGASSGSPLVIRKDLDGLVFLPPAASSASGSSTSGDATRPWKHVDTLPALSYVLASKRDLSRVYVRHSVRQPRAPATVDGDTSDGRTYDSVVLAFESPPQTDGRIASEHAGNLFVYYGQELARRGGEGEEEVTASRGRYAPSRVIRLHAETQGDAGAGDGGTGALVGVAAVRLGQGEDVLVCLCERRLIVLRGVL